MKSFVRTFLMTGVPFGFLMGLLFIYQSGMKFGVLSGIASGVFFGLWMAVFARIQENKARNSPPLLIEENLLREGPATHLMKRKGLTGRMYLTDKRLFFEAFPANNEVHEVSIPIHEVSNAVKATSFGVLSYQLHISLGDGGTEKFLIDDVNHWAKEILAVRQKYLSEFKTEEMKLFS